MAKVTMILEDLPDGSVLFSINTQPLMGNTEATRLASQAHNLIDKLLDGLDERAKDAKKPEPIDFDALQEFARDIRDNWDCDEDAHRYGTRCRCCEAEKILGPLVLRGLQKDKDNARD